MTNELKAALKLPPSKRLQLVEKIWGSLSPDDIPLSKAHKAELDKRLARLNRGKAKFYTWAEVKKKLHSRK